MKTLISIFLAIGIIGGMAGQVTAQTVNDHSAKNARQLFDQVDREGR